MSRFARLRWQLTLSHLAAIACTLVSMVGAVVLMVSLWLQAQDSPQDQPFQDARAVATAVSHLVARGSPSHDLNTVLRVLATGGLRLSPPFGPPVMERGPRSGWLDPWLLDVSYIVVVGRDGRPVASSEPAEAAFAPPEREEWDPLVSAALGNRRDPPALVALRPGGSPAALGAYPIQDERGQGLGAVVLARGTLPSTGGASFWRALASFSAASIVVLAAASLFALASAGLMAYLLARGLVARLERLGAGAEALAEGDLSHRVEEGRPDELGQLARRFNRTADRLAATIAELEATLKAKRDLVANASHELRTPLASIQGHVESLLMQPNRDERREYLAVIQREAEQLSRLVDDLFLLSAADAGALPLDLQPVALGEVVEAVVESIGPVARRERQVTVTTSIAQDLGPALADRQRVVQVLSNLVRNALRYTPEGGLVAVRAEQQLPRAVVTVEDTGDGIPPEQLTRVFERFYRGDDSRDRASGGAGLGLAIVRELVEAMGGEVSVESTVGQGSRFSFSLPLAVESAVAKERPVG